MSSFTAAPPRLILFVAFPRMGLLDLTGPQTVFWTASRWMEQRGLPGYVSHTVSLHGGLVRTAEGVELGTRPFSDFDQCQVDTILVPGAFEIDAVLGEAQRMIEWLRAAASRARRTTSVCSGTFLLAQAGLLDGKRVATHWMMLDLLKDRYPALEVDREAIFVRQDAVWTSAGVASGIDLALALVEADGGRDVAVQVARELVVYLKRPGGQPQHSEMLKAQAQESAPFDELHLWLSANLGVQDIDVNTLAERARMSPRNFARVYKQKTGRAPGKAVEMFRLEAARRLLENSSRNLDQIARQCGFGDQERMRVTFHRNLGISPSEYRKRFAAPGVV
ncbi:GlxA family transcriptional regulator [Duganella aceris]|uniref:Helix-turn-helix domain-containing protein n=1 Tax=Duganella aceris TaxID=2703883 RepID=A0ABX0FFD7_9BURK|nr:helix-turn-helix domain-containing protein [Duganella aceris]NGZ83259.1 helix-turn-helix domain-containing protein [Duganella aceris]